MALNTRGWEKFAIFERNLRLSRKWYDRSMGVDHGVEGVLTPLKYVGGVSVFSRPKLSHSFIQNCCWTTLQVSRHEE